MAQDTLDNAARSIRPPRFATARSAPTPRSARAPSSLEVELGDYSYVVNDSDIAYATIGKFCSIAAMTRINPGNHPMQRASQSHFTYRASAYFPGEADEEEFFAWRRAHRGHDRPRRLDRPRRDRPARPQHRHRRGGRGRRGRHQGRAALRDRRRQSGAARSASGFPAAIAERLQALGVVGLDPRAAARGAAGFPRAVGRGVSRQVRSRRARPAR